LVGRSLRLLGSRIKNRLPPNVTKRGDWCHPAQTAPFLIPWHFPFSAADPNAATRFSVANATSSLARTATAAVRVQASRSAGWHWTHGCGLEKLDGIRTGGRRNGHTAAPAFLGRASITNTVAGAVQASGVDLSRRTIFLPVVADFAGGMWQFGHSVWRRPSIY
jgi:hypothetical protein